MPHFVWDTLLLDEEAHGLMGDKITYEYDAQGRLEYEHYYRGTQFLFSRHIEYETFDGKDRIKRVEYIVDEKVYHSLLFTYDAEDNLLKVEKE